MNLFFEQNYNSTEVKPESKLEPKLRIPFPEGKDFARVRQNRITSSREYAEVGQNPCMEIILPTSTPGYRNEAHKLAYTRMRQNLLDTIKKAGGGYVGVDFTKMTVSELLLDLCTKDIGFMYLGMNKNSLNIL